ncbi:hypothetical protein Tco_0894941 [Tanacetum coccineum]|uniref:Uncharacterized protein n=1 Tax=Tanacetum coccineum TaxID=301880 RepID=A0ABQ5CJF3_9ASTR
MHALDAVRSSLGEEVWIFLHELVFTLPRELGTSLGVPLNFDQWDPTLLQPFNFAVYYFYRFLKQKCVCRPKLSSINGTAKWLVGRHFFRLDTWKVLCNCSTLWEVQACKQLLQPFYPLNGPSYLGFTSSHLDIGQMVNQHLSKVDCKHATYLERFDGTLALPVVVDDAILGHNRKYDRTGIPCSVTIPLSTILQVYPKDRSLSWGKDRRLSESVDRSPILYHSLAVQ